MKKSKNDKLEFTKQIGEIAYEMFRLWNGNGKKELSKALDRVVDIGTNLLLMRKRKKLD